MGLNRLEEECAKRSGEMGFIHCDFQNSFLSTVYLLTFYQTLLLYKIRLGIIKGFF